MREALRVLAHEHRRSGSESGTRARRPRKITLTALDAHHSNLDGGPLDVDVTANMLAAHDSLGAPCASRVTAESLVTVVSQYAYGTLSPWQMTPLCSCAIPGRNPETSTSVTSWTLTALQWRTRRAG